MPPTTPDAARTTVAALIVASMHRGHGEPRSLQQILAEAIPRIDALLAEIIPDA
jgi:hypothetical protein